MSTPNKYYRKWADHFKIRQAFLTEQELTLVTRMRHVHNDPNGHTPPVGRALGLLVYELAYMKGLVDEPNNPKSYRFVRQDNLSTNAVAQVDGSQSEDD